jgi:hypothetical protein
MALDLAPADPTAATPPARPRPRPADRRLAVWYVLVACFGGFLGLQVVLAMRQARIETMWSGFGPGISWRVWPSVAAFAAASMAGLMAVSAGRRRSWMVPALLVITVPIVSGTGPLPRAPAPLGAGWVGTPTLWTTISPGMLWTGALVDPLLVLAPAAVLAIRRPRGPGPSAVASRGSVAAAVALSSFGLALLANVLSTGGGGSGWSRLWPLVPTFAAGALAGGRRPWRTWWPLAVAAVGGLFASGVVGSLLAPPRVPTLSDLVGLSWLVLAAAIGWAWDPLAVGLDRLGGSAIGLLVAVNVLNLADAALTVAAVGSGEAVETNPVVRLIGLPAKVVLVGAVSWLLFRRRPKALAVPLVVLLGVLGYHLAGLAVRG